MWILSPIVQQTSLLATIVITQITHRCVAGSQPIFCHNQQPPLSQPSL